MTDWSNTVAKLQEACKILADARAQMTTDASGNYLADEALVATDGLALDTDLADAFNSGRAQTRAGFANSVASGRGMIDPLLLQFARLMGRQNTTDPASVIPLLYDSMALNQLGFTNAPVFQSRSITRGAYAGSGTGNGTVLRLNVDQYGFPLESGFAEVLKYQVLADSNSGTNPGQEQFEVTSLPFRDALQRYQSGWGSGVTYPTGKLTGITGDDTQSLVLNPSFSDASGAGAAFALAGWTIDVPANCSLDTAHRYRDCAVESTPASLKLTGTTILTQTLSSRAGALDQAKAYMAQIAVNFTQFAGTGSVRVDVGNLNWTLASGSAGWLASTAPQDKNLYFYNFNKAGLTVTITITLTGGTAILIDDFLWAPFTNLGGTLFAAVGGTTNWKYYDSGTTTDSCSNDALTSNPGRIQRVLSETYGWSFPSITAAAAPTTPLTAAAGAAAAAGPSAGLHAFAYSYTTTAGETPLSAFTYFTFDGATKASLTAIANGPGGTLSKLVYMTRVIMVQGQPTYAWYRVATIANNVTTTATIDIADATLATPVSLIQDV